MQLRLKHLFYVTALFAAWLNLAGWFGIFLAALISSGWCYLFFATGFSRRQRALELGIVVLVLLLLFACLLPGVVSHARPAARRMQCGNNIKQLCLALHNYHDHYGSFPPAITYDAAGVPLHSWRVLLLPWLE